MSEIDPKLSHLYRETATEEPPAALDAAILAAARKHAARPERRARSSWLSWMAPASAIATLVLGVSIAFLVQREQPAPARDLSIHPIALSAPSAGATQAAKAKTADRAAPAPAVKTEVPASAPAAPAPAAAAPAAPVLSPAAQAFPAENRAKASASDTKQESNVERDSALGRTGAPAPAAPVAAPPAPVAAPAAAAGRLAPLRQPAAQRSPEAWLEQISRLKREGRDKEAAEQLAEFRKAYPAYSVPEALLK